MAAILKKTLQKKLNMEDLIRKESSADKGKGECGDSHCGSNCGCCEGNVNNQSDEIKTQQRTRRR